jgi:4-amino-4-deoxy-L-arabinose transferase-like glycosyltransferase
MRLILNFFDNIYNNQKSLLVFIFFISILFSLIFLSFFKNVGPPEHGVPGTDYFVYYEPIANNILQGKGITVEGRVYPSVSPGFPVFLSGIFALSQFTGIEKLDLIVVFNVILTAFACCFLYLIAKEIFNKKIALISSFLWMSYPFNLWFLKNPNTEVPFIPLLYAGILFYILILKRKDLKFALLAGITLGLASLVRPIGIFLPFFLSGLLIILLFLKFESKKKTVFLAIFFLTGSLLAIFPWMVYSYSKTGGFLALSTQVPLGISIGITWLSGLDEKTIISNDVQELVERVQAEDLNSFTKLSQFFVQELKNNPLSLVKLIGLKLVRSWYATSSAWYEKETLIVQLIYLLPGLFGLIYLIKTNKNKILTIFPFLAIVFYFWGIAFITVSIMRYMIPAMGLIIIFSAITVDIVIDRLVKKFKLYFPCQP